MITFISSALLLLGALFALVAAIGIVRMPDIYCRMHAATKAGAFGVSLILLALCVAIPTLRVCIQSILIIAFFYLTAPVAAHLIGRVGIIQKLPLWKP
ncbi:MAG: multicomponent Na+:H+ antiporter subunit G [Lentimonas sp.]|jgi:multicomponent Na+:H+ antiporter subunit G